MPPLTLLIKPASGICNMRCSYCFYADVKHNREVETYGMMSPETLENLVRNAFEYAGERSFISFAFQGGEPTLAGLDFYKTLLELQRKYNTSSTQVQNSIQTNGLVIDREWAEFFAKNKFLVGLSLDGTKAINDTNRVDAAGRGTYSRIKKAAFLLESAKVEFNILCVVTSELARHSAQVYDALVSDGFRYLQFIQCLDGFDCAASPYSLTSTRYGDFLCTLFDRYYSAIKNGEYISVRTLDNYMELIAGYPPTCCGMTGVCECYFTIEGDGSVYPCDFYVIDRYRMGNINETGFASLRESQAAQTFVDESNKLFGNCRECEWFALCRGGCRRHREPFSDGQPSPNRFCEAYKRFFNYAYPRMLELKRYLRR